MKRLLLLTCALVSLLGNVCYADVYSVDITGVNKKAIVDKVANDMVSTNGFLIANINEYQAIFRKDMTAAADQLRYGSNYNRIPEYRLSCNFTQGPSGVRVTMEPKVVTNPGSAYESYSPLKDATVLNYLNRLKYYFNNRIDTGLEWITKKKGDCVEIVGVAKNSSAEKAGIVVGDLIAKIDGTPVKELSMDKFMAIMSGPEGKQINLILKRPAGDVSVVVVHSLIPAEYQPDKQ